MDPHHRKHLNAFGVVVSTTALVLLIDIVAAFVALLPIMGDKTNGDYSSEETVSRFILAIYLLCLLGLGVRLQVKHHQTARFIGVLLGAIPMLWVMRRFLFKSYSE
ncbi:hypothetical protein [Hymenobacter jejuensis]|uniref:hypothetical protein n=1 Tax=Hymenobacter jejuensis TaxID=2502781 RepID=UPI001E3FF5EF|nr:hypothetical protein [Hymenobacter jejuensis]